jgi:aminoglycoside 3-N-acetyltransferase I
VSHVPPVTIRRLGADQAGLLRQLLGVFGESFQDVDTYTRQQPSEAYLQGLLRSDYFIALAAFHDDTAIGGLAAYELKKFERERSEIYIYDLAITAKYRRRGIATKLIGQLRAIAKARGAYVIFVQADPVDKPAIALYSKFGVREDVLHFDIVIS